MVGGAFMAEKQQNVKFSVIIPVYNVQKYLVEAIRSIQKQTYNYFEIILVDDGSIDGSSKLCDDFAKEDDRIRVIHKENGGVSSARNSGIAVSTGDYMLFVDSDDYWCDDILLSIDKTIRESYYPDIVYANENYLLMPKGEKNTYSCGLLDEEFNKLYGDQLLKYMLTKPSDNLWCVWRAAYRINMVKNDRIYFKQGIILGEDADWLFRVLQCTQSCVLFHIPFYVYRMNRIGSAMNIISRQSLESFLQIIKQWIVNYDKEQTPINKIICSKLCNNYVAYFKHIFFYEKTFCNKLIKEINDSNLLDFVDSTYACDIRKKIQKNGFEVVLRNLNRKFKIRQYIRLWAIKMNIIDR